MSLYCRPVSNTSVNSSISGGMLQAGLFAAARDLANFFQRANAEWALARPSHYLQAEQHKLLRVPAEPAIVHGARNSRYSRRCSRRMAHYDFCEPFLLDECAKIIRN
jgi:hypothetical protein